MPKQNPIAVAQVQLQQGRHKGALKTVKSAMARHPKDARFPNLAGLAMCGLGQQRAAIPMFQKAIRLDPHFVDAQRNLAQTLILLGMTEKALNLLERMVAIHPEDEGAHYLQAQALANLGLTEAAETAASRAAELAPGQPRNFNLRGVLRNTLGLTDQALADFETALRLDPTNVDTLINISLPLARQTRYDAALDAARRAVALAPAHIGAHLRLAASYLESGDKAAARGEYREILTLEPQNAEAIEHLAALQTREQNASLSEAARAALKRAGSHHQERASLNFGLARIAQQTGDRAAEARYLTEANRDMARALPYDAIRDSALNHAIMARFPAAPDVTGPETPVTPIYVLGLPRSGTTLAEAMLGAHPAVRPLGEQIVAGRQLYPLIESERPFDAAEVDAYLSAERRMLPDLPEGTTAFTDKMPENYRLIGFLKTVHPGARFVHLRRDPRDVALSMWRGHFSGSALNYTYDLRGMAHRFNLYAEIMAFWHRLLPGQILDLPYEEMTADPEAASRTLAAHCGLDWVPQMARPHETGEAVLTSSAAQLRQPVHRRSVGAWSQHAETLAPFIAGLDPALWPGLDS